MRTNLTAVSLVVACCALASCENGYNPEKASPTASQTPPLSSKSDSAVSVSRVSEEKIDSGDPNIEIISRFQALADDSFNSEPALSKDGSGVISSFYGTLYFFNSDGSKRASYKLDNNLSGAPAILKDGTVVISGQKEVLFVRPDGTLKARFNAVNIGPNNERWPSVSGPTGKPLVLDDQSVVIGSGDGNVYFLDSSGAKKSQFSTSGTITSSPVLGKDGSIVVGSNDGFVYFLNADGTKKHSFNTHNKENQNDSNHFFDGIYSTPAVMTDGTVVVGANDGQLYFLNIDGSKRTSFEFPKVGLGYTDILINQPAVFADGKLVVATSRGMVYLLDASGIEKRFQLGFEERIQSSPRILKDGTTVVGGFDGHLHFINRDGQALDSFRLEGYANTVPTVGLREDETIVVGCSKTVTFLKFKPKAFR